MWQLNIRGYDVRRSPECMYYDSVGDMVGEFTNADEVHDWMGFFLFYEYNIYHSENWFIGRIEALIEANKPRDIYESAMSTLYAGLLMGTGIPNEFLRMLEVWDEYRSCRHVESSNS